MPRSSNGKIEKDRLNFIVNQWNNQLHSGDPRGPAPGLAQKFSSVNININLVDKFTVAGGSNNHFDIIIWMKDGRLINIEHKAIKETENNPEHPWNLNSIPQLINGTYNNFEISRLYCLMWYYTVLPHLRDYFPILPEIPPLNEWLTGDASFGKPKTEFGLILKKIREADDENKRLINSIYYNSIKVLWKNILESHPHVLENFKQELLTKFQECLSQKDLWLNCCYETTDSIESKKDFLTITPQISNISIDVDLNEDKNKAPKITLKYNLSSNPNKIFQGEALLRWGNGNGISNIRWNIS